MARVGRSPKSQALCLFDLNVENPIFKGMFMNMDAEDDLKSPGDVSVSEDSESSASSEDFGSPALKMVSFMNAEGKLLWAYKCVLGVTKDIQVGPEKLLSCICSLKKPPPTVVILAGGGYFAAAVFQGKKAVAHKTFHRYTGRAKGGGAQSAHDARNKGHKAKSAGACLRRHNQAALMMDINCLLSKWKEHITEARWIFLRVPRADRSLFLGRDTLIAKEDPRVFDIPFATRRATFEEVQRVHATLFSLQVQGTVQEDIPEKSRRTPEKYDLKSQIQIPGPILEEEEDEKRFAAQDDRARRALAFDRRLAACKEAAGSDASKLSTIIRTVESHLEHLTEEEQEVRNSDKENKENNI